MKGAARVVANAKEIVHNNNIYVRDTLSYVKTLTSYGIANDNRKGQIIVLCKKEQRRSNTGCTSREPKIERNNRDRNAADYIGSPLKDTCTIDAIDESFNLTQMPTNPWDDEEEYLKGIPQLEAARLMSAIAEKVDNEGHCTIWAICEENAQKILLTSRMIRPDRFHRGCAYFHGLVALDSIQIRALMDKHGQYIAVNPQSVHISVDRFFSLLNNNNVSLQISRSSSGHASQSYLTDNAVYDAIVLHQNIPIGDPSSLAMGFWMQLQMLDSIKGDIIRYQESMDPSDLVYSIGASKDMKLSTIKADIMQLISDVQIFSADNDDASRSKEIDCVIERAILRPQAEITDLLWTLLKWCGSYADLLAAFNHLFVSIAKHNVVNIPSSKNGVAKFIREICEQRLAVPVLKGTEPLELLVEIGLEKLERDYAFIFSEIGFSSSEEFESLMNGSKYGNLKAAVPELSVRKTLANVNGSAAVPSTSQRKTLMHNRPTEANQNEDEVAGLQNSVFKLDVVDRKMAKLTQTHLILEHMLCIRTDLNMDKLYTRDTFLSDMKRPAVPYDMVKNRKFDTREIIITNEEILSKIENEKPQSLRVVLYSENQMMQVRNTFHYSSMPIFPPSAFPCMQYDDETADGLYYSHQLLDISNRSR